MLRASHVTLFGLLLFLGISSASGQNGQGIECSVTKGKYRVHFTAYQEPKGLQGGAYLEKYCQDVPLTGQIFVTLDVYLTHGANIVRDRPVAVRFLEGAPGAEDAQTLLELPSKIYSSGIIEARPTFSEAGQYHVTVAIGENVPEEDLITIPLRVGMGSGSFGLLPLVLILIFGGIAYFVYDSYFRKKGRATEKEGDQP